MEICFLNNILVVFISSCNAPGRVGCWWSMENVVQPLSVPQPNLTIYNPNYPQQMQYQNNACNQYNSHQPCIPVQHVPVTMAGPQVTAVTARPAYSLCTFEEPKPSDTRGQAINQSDEISIQENDGEEQK